MSEKYQKLLRSPQPPFLRGENFLKVPLFKGDLGGSLPFKRLDNDFSDILLNPWWVIAIGAKSQ
jgi:hypothetical protein